MIGLAVCGPVVLVLLFYVLYLHKKLADVSELAYDLNDDLEKVETQLTAMNRAKTVSFPALRQTDWSTRATGRHARTD